MEITAAAATAASVTTNAREGIDDRDPEVFGSLAAEPSGGRPERIAIDSPEKPRGHDELRSVRKC